MTPEKIDLPALLREAVEHNASDLHLCTGAPPVLRVNGSLKGLNLPPLTADDTQRLIYTVLNDMQKAQFEEHMELDFSLTVSNAGRFRVNVHRQRGAIEAAFRVVRNDILSVKQLGLPDVTTKLCRKQQGLILITGPTGTGKTTTLAAMIDQINRTRSCMIITIEDPIEFIHKHQRSLIKQREVFGDTHSFAIALRHALRQDPDVIAVGEMRDLETIQTALTAAETGHLVLATIHTPDVSQTVDRVVDVFPPHQQNQVRIQLAGSLEAIISQQLVSRADGAGRVVACEVLVATPAVRQLVRAAKTEQIMTVLQTSKEEGMISMDKALKNLYEAKTISYEEAISKCKSPQQFDRA